MPREEIFRKYKAGTLKSGSGHKVTSHDQAVAIAMKYKPERKARGGFIGNDEPPQPGFTTPGKKRGGRQAIGRHAQAVPKGKGGFKVNMQAYKRGGLVY